MGMPGIYDKLKVSVIIVTLNRPHFLKRCLECLFAQDRKADQIIVVDSSLKDDSRLIVESFTGAIYLRNEKGPGHVTHSRNIGIEFASGDIIAFLDDDAFARPDWLVNILATYTDPSIGGVGGRTLNNQPGEETAGIAEIGRLKPDGSLTGYFAADPGKIIEVDHIIGANMSFRSDALSRLGGLSSYLSGYNCYCEDTDICLRVKRLGYRLLFNPAAVALHVGAPQTGGRRFDYKYCFYATRNHYILLRMNYGMFAPIVWRYLFGAAFRSAFDFVKKICAAFVRLASSALGILCGICYGQFLWIRLKMKKEK